MKTALLIGLTLLSANLTLAQTPPPSSTNPSSASSPHQRDTTSTTTTTQETPAADSANPSNASTPHQKQVTKQDKMINDCITKRQSETSSLSKNDAKKACEAEMKK